MGEPLFEKAEFEQFTVQFAIDDNAAETQCGRRESQLPSAHQAEPQRPATQRTSILRKGSKKFKSTEFREDARIWQLYLEDAQERAAFKTSLWYNSVDTLLVFAGLFAGLVAAFVIDARKDLQFDSEPRLLARIFNVLQGGSISEIFRTTRTAYWVNGLWILSLSTTLFSALVGVMAKVGLSKYALAMTKCDGAPGAVHRYRVDQQAERFYSKHVLFLVPLLVQSASVMFLIGLIIQMHADNPTLGRVLLAFCLAGGLAYSFIILLPLRIPSSPANLSLSTHRKPLIPEDMNDALGMIMYTEFIQSQKPGYLDEAITEVALPAFEQKWTEFLCKNDTPKILLSRFRQCASSRTSDTLQRDETLCNHLLALLSFAELYETRLHEAFEKKQTLQGYDTLDKALHEALSHENGPLHRWNELPEGLRPLHFALRTHVLVLLHLPQNGGFKPHAPSDFNPNEMADRPWEMPFQDIRSSHRIHFTLAACRGLIEGESHLKTISSFILSLCLAKAALAGSETGRTSEWASSLAREERDNVDELALRYIFKLYHATVTGWEDMAADALREILPVEVPLGDTESTRGHAGVLRCLIFSLSQPSHALRVHAFKMLKLVSSPNPALFSRIINSSVPTIATMTVYDDQGVQDEGLELLIELVKANEEMAESIRSAVVTSVQSGLSKYDDHPRISTIQFVEKLCTLQGSDNVFTSSISDVIPNLVELFMDNSAPDQVRQAALKLSERLWSVNSFDEVKSAILDHLGAMLEKNEFSNRYEFLSNLQALVKAKDFASGKERLSYAFPWYSPADLINDIMPSVFEEIVKVAIYEEDRIIADGAQEFLKSLAKSGRLNGHLPNLKLMTWLEAVTVRPSRWRVRHNALLVVETLSKQLTVTAGLLNVLVEAALADDDDNVRTAAIELVSDLWKKPCAIDYDIAQEVKETIISGSHKNAFQNEVHTDIRVREKWVLFLGEVAEYVALSEAIPITIQVAVARGGSSDFRSKAVALLVSDGVTKESNYCEVVKASVPEDLEVKLPCTGELVSIGKWVKLLIDLLPHAQLQDVARRALAGVVSSVRESLDPTPGAEPGPPADPLEDENSVEPPEPSSDESNFIIESDIAPPLRRLLGKSSGDGRMYWVEILANLAEHFPDDFPDAPKIVLQIAMYDPDGDVRNMALQSLRPLAKQDKARNSFLDVVVERMERMADDGDWNVRFALAQLLAILGASKECKLPEQAMNRLTTMALEDRDYDVRAESVNSLAVLLANDAQYPELATAVLEKFETGVKDGHWKARQSWMKFIPPHIKDAGSACASLVFDLAINDGEIDVRNTAVAVLEELLGDAKLRDAMASKIGKSLASAIKNDEQHTNPTSLLTRLTTPKLPDGMDADSESTLTTGHEIWIGVTMLLGRNGFQGVPKIVEMAIKDRPGYSYTDLKDCRKSYLSS